MISRAQAIDGWCTDFQFVQLCGCLLRKLSFLIVRDEDPPGISEKSISNQQEATVPPTSTSCTCTSYVAMMIISLSTRAMLGGSRVQICRVQVQVPENGCAGGRHEMQHPDPDMIHGRERGR